MTKTKRKLALHRTTLVELSKRNLEAVNGGFGHLVPSCAVSCLPDGCVSFASEVGCPSQVM